MTTLYVDDFKSGLDVRKSILTAKPGSLQTLDNCVVSAGGEIVKAMAMVPILTLPAGTKGMFGTSDATTGNPLVWVFAEAVPATPNNYGPGHGDFLATISTITPAQAVLVAQGSAAYKDQPITIARYRLQVGTIGETVSTVLSVEEYGPHSFFVVANITMPPVGNTPGALVLRNWYNGAVLTHQIGTGPLINGGKMYRVSGSVVYFSGVGDPSAWNPLDPTGLLPNTVNPGAGFIDLALLSSAAFPLIGAEQYFKQVALFGRYSTFLFAMDPNPANNLLQQVLHTGAISPETVLPFGSGDVLFLSDIGVRSLRVQNLTFSAGVEDVGSPVDLLVQAKLASSPYAVPRAIVDPLTGRYWLAIGNTIFILSYWPSARINAWSTINLPANIDAMCVAGLRIFVRCGDVIYLYGGPDGATYDTAPATVVTPFMSADTPTTRKKTISIGAMIQGNWALSIGMQTDNPALYELAANLSGNTYSEQMLPFAGNGTHISFKLTTSDASPALLGAVSVRFEKTIEE